MLRCSSKLIADGNVDCIFLNSDHNLFSIILNDEKEQLYKGYSKSGFYLCYLKISPDNKVVFTYQTDGNWVYGEHSGTIKALNDSTFHVSCKLTFGQFACKAPALDTLSIFVDPPSLISKKSILVRYDNEDLMTNANITKSGLSFVFNDRLFN